MAQSRKRKDQDSLVDHPALWGTLLGVGAVGTGLGATMLDSTESKLDPIIAARARLLESPPSTGSTPKKLISDSLAQYLTVASEAAGTKIYGQSVADVITGLRSGLTDARNTGLSGPIPDEYTIKNEQDTRDHYHQFSVSPVAGYRKVIEEAGKPYGYGDVKTFFEMKPEWGAELGYDAAGNHRDGHNFFTRFDKEYGAGLAEIAKLPPSEQAAALNQVVKPTGYKSFDKAVHLLHQYQADKSPGINVYGGIASGGKALRNAMLIGGLGLGAAGATGLLLWVLRKRRERKARERKSAR